MSIITKRTKVKTRTHVRKDTRTINQLERMRGAIGRPALRGVHKRPNTSNDEKHLLKAVLVKGRKRYEIPISETALDQRFQEGVPAKTGEGKKQDISK